MTSLTVRKRSRALPFEAKGPLRVGEEAYGKKERGTVQISIVGWLSHRESIHQRQGISCLPGSLRHSYALHHSLTQRHTNTCREGER